MITLLTDIADKILEHSRESYPHECCGLLAGKSAGDGAEKVVSEVHRMTNTNHERAGDRFEIDPRELLKAEKAMKLRGLDILGFYHSHPDHPARPSDFDRQRGWPEYSYIIVAVKGGVETEMTCWTFNSFDEPFRQEDIVAEG
ncbi:MAG: M67 family metallopeptidase [Deltaproteobacteria bacterium]|nr:M67 family metallopeptidase [Deltaproteobacteria bacterium]